MKSGWLIANYLNGSVGFKASLFLAARYNDQKAKVAEYLTWPDARLRAYLREHGVSEEYLPGDRPGLLRE